MTAILIPVSVGELLDKIIILEIKAERLHDPAQLANVQRELVALKRIERTLGPAHDLAPTITGLKAVNRQLWDIEDQIRECEARRDFGKRFVELARSIYRLNDERARLKKAINVTSGSALVEEKSYKGM
jgi:hypothetical protein